MPGRFLLTRPSRDVTRGIPVVASGEHQFLLTRPSRDVTQSIENRNCRCEFLLTRPSRDVTTPYVYPITVGRISTHTPLAGRDPVLQERMQKLLHFYSHAPRGT